MDPVKVITNFQEPCLFRKKSKSGEEIGFPTKKRDIAINETQNEWRHYQWFGDVPSREPTCLYQNMYIYIYVTLCQFHLLEKEKALTSSKVALWFVKNASPCLFEALSIKGTASAFFTSLKVVFMPSTCLAKACFSLQDSFAFLLSWISGIPPCGFGGWFLLRGDCLIKVSQ